MLQASALIKDICQNLQTAVKLLENVDYTVVLRGDSTLRGHFPEARIKSLLKLFSVAKHFRKLQIVTSTLYIQEADAAVSVLGEMDAWIICPFFLQGGRYTIDDVHYVADADM